MAEIDNLTARMAARDVNKVVICGGKPMRLFSAKGVVDGPVLTSASLASMVDEIMAQATKELPAMDGIYKSLGRISFGHPTPHGQFNITIVRDAGGAGLKLTVTRIGSIWLKLAGVLIFVGGLYFTWVQVQAAHVVGRFLPYGIVMAPCLAFVGLPLLFFGNMGGNLERMKLILTIFAGVGAAVGFGVYMLLKLGLI